MDPPKLLTLHFLLRELLRPRQGQQQEGENVHLGPQQPLVASWVGSRDGGQSRGALESSLSPLPAAAVPPPPLTRLEAAVSQRPHDPAPTHRRVCVLGKGKQPLDHAPERKDHSVLFLLTSTPSPRASCCSPVGVQQEGSRRGTLAEVGEHWPQVM